MSLMFSLLWSLKFLLKYHYHLKKITFHSSARHSRYLVLIKDLGGHGDYNSATEPRASPKNVQQERPFPKHAEYSCCFVSCWIRSCWWRIWIKRSFASPLGSRLLPYPTCLTRAVETAGDQIWKTVLTVLTGFFHPSPGPKPSKGSGLWARDWFLDN